MSRPRHFSMLRDFHLADWFTLANAFCGTGAIFAAMRFLQEGVVRDLLVGMALIPLAFIFDALDGRVARWRKSLALGRELDSLADVISFGVAPAALAYACGLQGGWDWVGAVVFRGLRRQPPGALQRDRRVAVGRRDDKVKFFEGTPIPTSLLLVVVLALAAFQGPHRDGRVVRRDRSGPVAAASAGAGVRAVGLA